MIKFTLKCAEDHRFESWFRSTEAFDKLVSSGKVACAVCGSTQVEKAMMAPHVQGGRDPAAQPDERALSQPSGAAEQALARLRRHVEENSEDVGRDFVTEARRIHEGAAPERSIHGEARADEAKKLIDDGLPVAPLPFTPRRKSN
ncbi:DUF1178 family protein [Roseovarius salinarum]|uniref:DUF1178 family protein n=1 Tax=Roseovarius salinarum TaxID=1981892 RepID=UPI000C32FE6F|nr:DUF1178 family protein [Roseovarius salinarum]